MPQASIDLGTNTCLLLIQEGSIVLHDETQVVRLGQGVDQARAFHPDAMERTLQCLKKYAQILNTHGVPLYEVFAVGTAQARDAKNASEFFSRIQKELGIQFRILSGDEEAAATFYGALFPGSVLLSQVVMDIGGGSTELVTVPDDAQSSLQILGKSLDIGAVRMTERLLKSDPVTDEEFWDCEKAIDEALSEMIPWRENLKKKKGHPHQLVAVAGTAVTLGMLQLSLVTFDQKKLDGLILSRGDLHRWVEELKWRSVSERKILVGMEEKRADVILAGALIFWRTMEVLGFETAQLSTRGLRYGVLALKPVLDR